MSDWGTPVMLLGRTPRRRPASAGTPATTSATGAPQATPPDTPLNIGYLAGSYAGAWLGGAAVGYVVGHEADKALTGGMAASGVWGIGETIAFARERDPWLSALFLALGAGSLAFAWRRR